VQHLTQKWLQNSCDDYAEIFVVPGLQIHVKYSVIVGIPQLSVQMTCDAIWSSCVSADSLVVHYCNLAGSGQYHWKSDLDVAQSYPSLVPRCCWSVLLCFLLSQVAVLAVCISSLHCDLLRGI